MAPVIEIKLTLLADGSSAAVATMSQAASDWLTQHNRKLFVELRPPNERGEIVHDNDELLSAAEAVLSPENSFHWRILNNDGAKLFLRLQNAVAAMRAARQQAEAKAKGEAG